MMKRGQITGVIGAVVALLVVLVIAFTVAVPVISTVINESDLAGYSEVTASTAYVATTLTQSNIDSAIFVYGLGAGTSVNSTALAGANDTIDIPALNGTVIFPLNANLTVLAENYTIVGNDENITVSINGNSLGWINNASKVFAVSYTYLTIGSGNTVTFSNNETGTLDSNITSVTLNFYNGTAYTDYNLTATTITTGATNDYWVGYNFHEQPTFGLISALIPLFFVLGILLMVIAWVYTKLSG